LVSTKVGGQQRPWKFKAFDGTGLKGGLAAQFWGAKSTGFEFGKQDPKFGGKILLLFFFSRNFIGTIEIPNQNRCLVGFVSLF